MITIIELKNASIPFYIKPVYLIGKHKGKARKVKPSKVVGYFRIDPLFINTVCVSFDDGSWITLDSLMQNHTIVNHNE